MTPAADNLVARMESAARVSAEEARQIADEMCAEGVRSAAEAEALVEFHARFTGQNADQDADWDGQFQRALRDYLLLRTVPEGGLSDDNLRWLRDTFLPDGYARDGSELDLLIMLQRQAEIVPPGYDLFVLETVCGSIRKACTAGAADVARLHKVLTIARRGRAAWISREEARCLWQTNAALGKAINDPSWNHLFARVIGNYLFANAFPQPDIAGEALSRQTWLDAGDDVPGRLTAGLDAGFARDRWFETLSPSGETARTARLAAAGIAASQPEHPSSMKTWLRRRLGWDNAANPAERALVDFLNREAPGLTAGLTIAAG